MVIEAKQKWIVSSLVFRKIYKAATPVWYVLPVNSTWHLCFMSVLVVRPNSYQANAENYLSEVFLWLLMIAEVDQHARR